MTKQIKFIDLDMNFTRHPSTNDAVRVFNETAIKESVKHLVLTHFYSRPFHPEIGSHVAGLLFELNSETTRYAIRNSIEQVITNYEPRAGLDDIRVKFSDKENAYYIEIFLDVKGILETVTLEFLLNRIR